MNIPIFFTVEVAAIFYCCDCDDNCGYNGGDVNDDDGDYDDDDDDDDGDDDGVYDDEEEVEEEDGGDHCDEDDHLSYVSIFPSVYLPTNVSGLLNIHL